MKLRFISTYGNTQIHFCMIVDFDPTLLRRKEIVRMAFLQANAAPHTLKKMNVAMTRQ